jgi:zinc/manganese transport system ATP-binding protein
MAVRFHDLTLGYDGFPAVHHLDGTVEPGSLTALVGPNGSGKSTLLKGIVGLIQPLGGAVLREGAEAGDVAYLPQSSEVERGFPATVFDLVSLGLWKRRGMFGGLRGADRSAIADALIAVGLDGFSARPIDSLSGGQLQRALFARVILQDARLILLDEPFNAIDGTTVADLLALIHAWHAEGRTIVAVLHDLDLVRAHFPTTLLLARHAVGWGDTATVLRPENLVIARAVDVSTDADAPYCAGRDAA